mmetsp:Transcript_27347/g.81497  ORF Transcript_27347/g.81497 Transcript_27347/m.81497 type:complete len:212 (-) Transcript_27347:380-1015(-)
MLCATEAAVLKVPVSESELPKETSDSAGWLGSAAMGSSRRAARPKARGGTTGWGLARGRWGLGRLPEPPPGAGEARPGSAASSDWAPGTAAWKASGPCLTTSAEGLWSGREAPGRWPPSLASQVPPLATSAPAAASAASVSAAAAASAATAASQAANRSTHRGPCLPVVDRIASAKLGRCLASAAKGESSPLEPTLSPGWPGGGVSPRSRG